MIKAYKTEINPHSEQIQKIHKTIGVCRFIYNFYISHNKEMYEKEKRFVTGMDFSKWINNIFILNNPEYSWIKEVGSKAVKQAIMNGDKAFKNFFKKKIKFP
jgi:putative transposase